MRLIDADKAIALAKDIVVETKSGSMYKHRCIDPSCIEELPTVDAVPVIRCQNCRRWKQHTAVDIEGNLVYLDSGNCGARVTNKDDYCSRAERRDSDG